MKTIVFKIEYENVSDNNIITNDDRIYSSIVRYSYNRCCENKSATEIYKLTCQLFNDFPSHLITSANREAKSIYSRIKTKTHPINLKFGLVDKRKKLLISKEEFKQSRLRGIFSEGEIGLYKGNRYFSIDVDSRIITYKRSRNTHIDLKICEKLSNKRKQILSSLQLAMTYKKCPISFRLKHNKIYISYDETIIEKHKKIYNLKDNRILGLDLNPNYIGLSILKFDLTNNFQILHKEVFNISKLQSNGSKNKVKFELQQIDNKIISLCKHFKCSKLAIEDLKFKSSGKGKNKKQKQFNKLCKNKWRRSQVFSHLKMLCSSYAIEFVDVNAAYSSFVGNIQYGNLTTPDMVAASIEIARRGYKKFEKEWFYPQFEIEKIQKQLSNLKKKEIICTSKSWKELFNETKESNNKWFRFQLNENNAVFRKSYYKAMYNINIFK